MGFSGPGRNDYVLLNQIVTGRTSLGGYMDQSLEIASRVGIMKLPEGKTSVQIAADFLSEIRQHALRILEGRIAKTIATTPLEFWLTVPAIWSDKAKINTRNAALLAGFEGSSNRPNDRIFII